MSTSHLIYVSDVGVCWLVCLCTPSRPVSHVDECLWLHAVPHNILPPIPLRSPSWPTLKRWTKRKFVIHFLHWHFILPTNTLHATNDTSFCSRSYKSSTEFGLGCSYSLFVHKLYPSYRTMYRILNTMSPCAVCRVKGTDDPATSQCRSK